MSNSQSSDNLHELPQELKTVLETQAELQQKWDDLTPLARNEWICWITIAKKAETRENRLERLKEEIHEGKRRPCCWPGCPHRRDSAKKWFK